MKNNTTVRTDWLQCKRTMKNYLARRPAGHLPCLTSMAIKTSPLSRYVTMASDGLGAITFHGFSCKRRYATRVSYSNQLIDPITSSMRISSVPWLSLYHGKKSVGKSLCPQKITFKSETSPVILYKLWNKNAIVGRRWNIAMLVRRVYPCSIEIKIVTFVIKGMWN